MSKHLHYKINTFMLCQNQRDIIIIHIEQLLLITCFTNSFPELEAKRRHITLVQFYEFLT